MELKICSKCKVEKDIEKFSWHTKSKGYRRSYCKSCGKEYMKQYRQENKEYQSEYEKQYYQDNKERNNERNKKYRQANPDKINALNAKHRAQKLNQTPNLTENEKAKVVMYYTISQHLGEDWHVDHIQPLKHGGLHHPDNLQVVTKKYNMAKQAQLNFREPEPLEYFKI